MNLLRKLYKNTVKPFIPRNFHQSLATLTQEGRRRKSIRHKILSCSKVLPQEEISAELVDIIDFLKNNPYSMFPYNFTKKYWERKIPVYYDSYLKMTYIAEDNKKMYFKRGITKPETLDIYNAIALEQDCLSPHRYLTNGDTQQDFTVNAGDVVVDLGVAEGNFALSIIDIAAKVYLFECDMEWVRALEATFRDYNDKVVIVPKYVSDIDDENCVSLDNYFASNETINFIKADIEGYEWQALQGMEKLLKRNTDIRAAICTYHNPTDAENFKKFFREIGFDVNFTHGYMLLDSPPYLRKGVLRVKRKVDNL